MDRSCPSRLAGSASPREGGHARARAALLATVPLVLVPAAPASAAGSGGGCGPRGVVAVVEPGSLGGAPQVRCAPEGGGSTAADVLETLGWRLDWVQQQPGFVCRVDGEPATDPCVVTPPGDAYWGLFVADGAHARWGYAATGAAGLTVPPGGSVALVWQDSRGRAAPATAPRVARNVSGTAAPRALRSPSASSHAPSGDGGGLPWWAGGALVAALTGAVAAVALRRRRSS